MAGLLGRKLMSKEEIDNATFGREGWTQVGDPPEPDFIRVLKSLLSKYEAELKTERGRWKVQKMKLKPIDYVTRWLYAWTTVLDGLIGVLTLGWRQTSFAFTFAKWLHRKRWD